MIRRRLVITGRVQGVFYRAWLAEQARAIGIDGWVRNRLDGSVELLAIGEAEQVDRLALACALGPSGARVAAVVRLDAEDDGSVGFQERATV